MRIYFDAIRHDDKDCLLISIPTTGNETYPEMYCRVIDLMILNRIDPYEYIVKLSHGFSR